jgi:hypothetical protein
MGIEAAGTKKNGRSAAGGCVATVFVVVIITGTTLACGVSTGAFVSGGARSRSRRSSSCLKPRLLRLVYILLCFEQLGFFFRLLPRKPKDPGHIERGVEERFLDAEMQPLLWNKLYSAVRFTCSHARATIQKACSARSLLKLPPR